MDGKTSDNDFTQLILVYITQCMNVKNLNMQNTNTKYTNKNTYLKKNT